MNTNKKVLALKYRPQTFKDLIGPQSFFTTCYAPLFAAFPDLERRDWIVMGESLFT